MIGNLKERFLYQRLPEARVKEDERGLIEAVIGGYQDHLEDLRSFAKKISDFWVPGALPDGPDNAILVDLTSGAGKTYTRSLDIDGTTPVEDGTLLTKWAAQQLGLAVADVSNVRYGRDLLRLVDSTLLTYLATTIGAVLYQSIVLGTAEQQAASIDLVETWFPRLKIKGTAASFEVLGRILGFDDVRVTPLWTRLSPRVPDDIGDPDNDPDFSASSEYYPAQKISPYYNPFAYRDGPFFSWAGTATNGTGDSGFYPLSINGFNPWIEVVVLGSLAGTNVGSIYQGTTTHPATGSYALASGAPNFKAYVEPTGSSVRFQALAEGDDFNGLVIHTTTSGSYCEISIDDRLSALKYRSSYFDIGLSASMDKLEEVFGSRAASTNKDLKDDPTLTSDGTAVSPFRPWVGGSVAVVRTSADWTVESGSIASVVTARTEADPTEDRQLNIDSVVAAGVQVIQAFEEVRAATRLPRQSQIGFLIDDKAPYAAYQRITALFTTSGSTTYSGTATGFPLPSYALAVQIVGTSGTESFAGEYDSSGEVLYFQNTAASFSGTYDLSTARFGFQFTSVPATSTVYALWTPTTTEIIRTEPTGGTADKAYQARPEDEEGSVESFVYEVSDDFGWRRDLVVGGELVELDTYASGTEIAVEELEEATAFNDQTGVDLNVFGINSTEETIRVVIQHRATDAEYKPAEMAVGYKGTIRNLADFSGSDTSLPKPTISGVAGDTKTDCDTLFAAGYGLYHIGSAQGVLVADLPKFFGKHHHEGLVLWLPCNEHPEDDLEVVDHSVKANGPALLDFTHTSRQWDDTHGWVLRVASASFSSDYYRDISTAATASFWFKMDVQPAAAEEMVRVGPLIFKSDSGFIDAYVLDVNGDEVSVGTVAITGAWQFVYLRVTPTLAILGAGTLSGAATESSTSGTFLLEDDTVAVSAVDAEYWLHDLRGWNVTKTFDQMALVRYHSPTATICTYRLGFIYTLDRQDKYGIRVLDNGWAVPDRLPAWYRRTRQGLVRRYDSMGSYHGESRYKETGIGDHRPLPTLYRLGQQFTALTAAGTAPFSTSIGLLPGVSDFWGSVTGSTTPTDTVYTNPFRESVWAFSPSTKAIYEMTLAGSGAATSLVASTDVRARSLAELGVDPYISELLTSGTVSATFGTYVVSGTANETTGSYSAYDSAAAVYRGKSFNVADLYVSEMPTGARVLNYDLIGSTAYGGTATPTAYYMYLNSRVNVQVNNAFDAWTDRNAVTAQDNDVDYSPDPNIVYATGSGTYLALPVLGKDGLLEFENTSNLAAGNYVLTVDTGNIGLLDEDFDGFAVEMKVNSTVIASKLMRGRSGYSPRGSDQFEFELEDSVNGNWLLSVEWTNALEDESKGTKRQLAIYGYSLRRIATEAFRVDVYGSAASPLITLLDAGSYAGTLPGGWFATINSYGTITGYEHESMIYPTNDTVTSKSPISDLLTALTCERREDIIYSGTDVVVTDTGSFTFPTFSGSISVSPVQSLYQVGDTGTFSVNATSSGSNIYSYVWNFWDSTSTATTTPYVIKVINIGGVPTTDVLNVSCTPVAIDGQSTTLSRTIQANNPPAIVPGAFITANDAFFAFATQVGLTAFDFEGDGVYFSWYNESTFLSHGTTTVGAAVYGTWTGNGATVVSTYTGTSNYFDTVVYADRTLTCIVSDSRGGTTSLDFDLRGHSRSQVQANAAAGVANFLVEATVLPQQRIGTDQTVDFSVYAKDAANGSLSFVWNFAGSNNWSMGPLHDSGTSTVLADGGIQNLVRRDISDEVVSSGTAKLVKAVCDVFSTDPVSGVTRFSEVEMEVTLIADTPPDADDMVVHRSISNNEISDTGPVTAGQIIQFSITGADPNGDVMIYKWVFTQPFSPSTATYWGPKILVDTSRYVEGDAVSGTLDITDRLGASITIPIPETDVVQ